MFEKKNHPNRASFCGDTNSQSLTIISKIMKNLGILAASNVPGIKDNFKLQEQRCGIYYLSSFQLGAWFCVNQCYHNGSAEHSAL